MFLKVGHRSGAGQADMEAAIGVIDLPRGFNRSQHFEQHFDFFKILGNLGIARQPLAQCLRLGMLAF
jgi:hypothetical protein